MEREEPSKKTTSAALNKGKEALAKYFAKAVNMYMLYFCFVVVVFLLLDGQF